MAGIDRNAVFATVKKHLAEILEVDESAIAESSRFVDDLGADSIALIELVDALEQEFSATLEGFQFDDEDLKDLLSVSDAVDYVVRAHA